MDVVTQIKTILNKIRPYLQQDGGDVEFVEFKEGIVYVRMLGACLDCAMLDDTLHGGIESMIVDEVPGVIGVENVVDTDF